jgi:hypothetical protein
MRHWGVTIWVKVLLSIGLGISLTLGLVSQVGLADAPDQPANVEPNPPPVLPYTYARVVTDNVLVYETSGITPVRSLGAGYVWVSLDHALPITHNEQTWYAINPDEYVQADQLALFTPSTFQGVTLTDTPEHPFLWMVFDMWASSEPGLPAGSGAPLFKRYTLLQIFEEKTIADRVWYRVGPDQWHRRPGPMELVLMTSGSKSICTNKPWQLTRVTGWYTPRWSRRACRGGKPNGDFFASGSRLSRPK